MPSTVPFWEVDQDCIQLCGTVPRLFLYTMVNNTALHNSDGIYNNES